MRCSHVEKGKKMDNLAKCAFLAKREGLSYGNWIAIYGEKVIARKGVPVEEGWKPCEYCGKLLRAKGSKRFCQLDCRNSAYYENNTDKIIQKVKDYQKRYRERKKLNGQQD